MDTRPQCGKGWADRCANSTGRECRCRCGGANHGKARGNAPVGGSDRSRKLTDPKVFSRPLERILSWDARTVPDIRLWREGDPDAVGTARASIPQRLIVHSPDGFEWGYGGSGPADLALNILARFTSPQDAYALHQDFKAEVIARMPKQGGTITAEGVVAWLREKFAQAAPEGYRVRESRATAG